ncbi:MAG: phosphatase PAP2 family protein [Glaciimonas sp.]|nr:phosphatase PAP2 family protein [Glaciimonas sp.]
MHYWTIITSYGGSAVMMPAAAAFAAWLALGRAWRMFFWWCGLFGAGLTIVIVSKIAFIGWGIGIPALDFTGFSGHAMRAMAVIPVLFYLVLQNTGRATRTVGVLVGLLLGALICTSRVAVQVHSVTEAISGGVLGAAVSLSFIALSCKLEKPLLNRALMIATVIGLIGLSYVEPIPSQGLLTTVALSLSGHDKPYTRENWKLQRITEPDITDKEQPFARM